MTEEARIKMESQALGLIYQGGQRNKKKEIEFFIIVDPENMGSFAVAPFETVKERLELHRRKFEPEPREA